MNIKITNILLAEQGNGKFTNYKYLIILIYKISI